MNNCFRSQCGEDKWIRSRWRMLGLPERGFFVEFGAGDGVGSSNSYWLEKAKCWKGLLIEPDPRHIISNRNRCIIERVAVGPAKTVSFGLDDHNPFLSGIRRLSKKRIKIKCVPLSVILKKHKIDKVDFISIDTEGTELEAWSTLDLKVWRPKVAIIEIESWGICNMTEEVIAQLTSDGYELVKLTRLNAIFKDAR